MKIMIIGSGGSGKSTFARQLSSILGLPVHHLDAYYYKPGWVPTPKQEWDEIQKRLVAQKEWIIDGNYGRTLPIRMNAADVIIYFDLSRWITTYRVIKRRVQYNGITRPDLNEGCPERLDWAFLKWVWNFKKTSRTGIMEKMDAYKDGKAIIVIRTTKQVKGLIKQLKLEGRSYFNNVGHSQQ
ncbi:DNA topology modulation protein [Paenibacillus mendelii]|uniref:DNA topology modulation protein n=1 Tax=Paenibacillus mendelii TaxID=206163 RepID=A0ABV6JFU5_9BACL|nr:DNA topology modulation protein [Paenibacillus mendelii]MCQ6557668.1 DNA topology modulation protein [Paenibacillus mendelii]